MKRISDLIEILESYKELYGNLYLTYNKVEDDCCHVDDDFIKDLRTKEKPYKIDSTNFYDRKLAEEHSGELVLSISDICNI